MKKISTLGLALAAVAALSLSAGCSSKPKAKEASSAAPSSAAQAPSGPAEKVPEPTDITVTPDGASSEAGITAEDMNRRGYLKDVFFDLDRSDVRGDQREALDQNATWLRKRPEVRIVIEGHCDERGTAQYNMALGERRAQTVMDYLVALGIPASRIQVMSYGKERPFARGHDDKSWAQNRRGHFVVTAVR
jgi:peptidoglycan-associated lipoprotein